MEGKELFHGAGCARARAADIQPVDSPNLIPLIPCRPKRNRVSVPLRTELGNVGKLTVVREQLTVGGDRAVRLSCFGWTRAHGRRPPYAFWRRPERARAQTFVRQPEVFVSDCETSAMTDGLVGLSDSGVAALLDKERQRSERRSTAAAASARLRARIRHRSMMSW